MSENVCPQCGAPIAQGATECKYCGEAIQQQAPRQQAQPQQQYQQQQPLYQQPVYQQPMQQQPYQQAPYQQPQMNGYAPNPYGEGINPAWPVKSKIAAGIIAILLGGLGIHKFYMGKVGMGILYLLFCWTGIPAFIGFIEGIVYLCSNDHNFQVNNHVRLQ